MDIDHLVVYIRQIGSEAEMHDADAQKKEVEAEGMKVEAKKSGPDTQRREAKALAWETEAQRGTKKAGGKMIDYGEVKQRGKDRAGDVKTKTRIEEDENRHQELKG